MRHIISKFWWILAIRGILGILLGLAAVDWIFVLNNFYPELFGVSIFLRWVTTAATLILLLGLYAFLDGLFSLLLGAQDYGNGRRWWALIVEGFLSIGLGALTWLKPNWTAMVLLYWIAFWAILTGLLEILQSFDLNEYKDRRRPFFFAGLCSVVFGVLVLFLRVGGLTLVWLVGAYSFAFGVPMLVLGIRLRHFWKASRHGR